MSGLLLLRVGSERRHRRHAVTVVGDDAAHIHEVTQWKGFYYEQNVGTIIIATKLFILSFYFYFYYLIEYLIG